MAWDCLSFPNWEWISFFHPTLYNGCNHLSMLWLNVINVSKGEPTIKLTSRTDTRNCIWRDPPEAHFTRPNDISLTFRNLCNAIHPMVISSQHVLHTRHESKIFQWFSRDWIKKTESEGVWNPSFFLRRKTVHWLLPWFRSQGKAAETIISYNCVSMFWQLHMGR